MVGGHHVAMRERSRVGRSLESHGVHVRRPRAVVRKVLRRHGHLVRHRGRSHSLGGGGTGSGSGAVVKEVLTAKGRCPRVEVVYWRLHRHGSRAVPFRRGEGSVAHVVKGLSR